MDKKNLLKKIVIIGAGHVGANMAYVMVLKNICNELVIIDINKDKADGECMDISDTLSIAGYTHIKSGDYSDVKDADIIVFTAGAARKPGQTRLDLAKININITKSCIENIMPYYDNAIFVIATNPVDVVTAKVFEWSGLPRHRVIGSGTILDTIRLKRVLGEYFQIDPSIIEANVYGEHGDSQFCGWSQASIFGASLDSYAKAQNIVFDDAKKAEIEKKVKVMGAEIIKRKGATFYGIGVAIAYICEVILSDRKSILPIASNLDGEYNIENGVVSVPTLVSRNGIEQVIELPLSEEETEKLKISNQTVKTIIDGLNI